MCSTRNLKYPGAPSTALCRVVALAAVLVLCGWGLAQSQEGNAAGFEIDDCGTLFSGDGPNDTPVCDTDLTCTSIPAGDDWAQGPANNGIFDNDGLPNDDYRAIHGVDPNWGNQGDGFDPTQFGGVSNKNNDPIADPLLFSGQEPWDWNGVGGGPQKNDITNTYVYTKTDENDHRWLFLAFETRSTNGDSHVDFELNVAGLKICDPDAMNCSGPGGPPVTGVTDGLIIGLGPDDGRTADQDFIVSTDFEKGGANPIARIRLWTETSTDVFEYVPVEDLGVDTTGKIFTATNICTVVHNTGGGDWTHFAGNGAPTDTLLALQLVETAIDLTGLGIDVNPCGPNTTLMFKTRSSQSFTAELKDWELVSFPFEPTPECAIDGPTLVCPGTQDIEYTTTETTGLSDVDFEWTIAGNATFCDGTTTATGTTVCVDADMVCDGNFILIVTATRGPCASTCLFLVDVDDNIPPEITCPADISVQCPDEVQECDPDDATASDNCGPVTVTCSDVSDGNTCPEVITRTFRATDFCGNTAECTQTITIDDTIPPVITCPANVTIDCSDPVPPADFSGGSASDNCGNVSVTHDGDSSAGDCPEVITRTYRATDDCGNTATCTQTITIVDDTPPEITCPANVTIDCSESVPAPDVNSVQTSDDCHDVTVTHVGDSSAGDCPEVITRTYRATDECGNSSTCTQTITIVDDTPPVITCPGAVTVQCIGDVPPVDTGSVQATDDCHDVTVTHVGDSPAGECPTIITRTYRATDECGNSATCTQTITVDDTIAPTVDCGSGNVEIACGEPFEFQATATDNCNVDPTITCTFVSTNPSATTVETLGNGHYRVTLSATAVVTVTCTATDDCDNDSESCSFTISATCNQACSPGYWRQSQHFDEWCLAGFQPVDNFCGPGPATLFVDAFNITNFDSSEIPASFSTSLTLLEAVNLSGGDFNQTLFLGTASLLNAAHPDVGAGAGVAAVQAEMQAAFSGAITFAQAKTYFAGLVAQEQVGGCPLN